MAYIGNTATTQAFTPAVDYFNGDGATVAFTLSKPVASVAQVQAVIENVPQNPGSAYTVSGNTITFTSAPPSGTSNIYVYYTSPITQVIAPSQGTVGSSQLQSNLSLTGGLTVDGPSVISVDSSSDALRITQTGSGNALLVEDSANPDSTPFVINQLGKVVVGDTTARQSGSPGIPTPPLQVVGNTYSTSSLGGFHYQDGSANASFLSFNKSRGTSLGTQTIVQSGDRLGGIEFTGSDGTAFIPAARIDSYVDGTPGTNDMPGRLVFSTTADGASSLTEQMRITSTGDLRFNSGYGSVATAYGCRAWVNFNGTGTVAIRASGNVSSITDNGTGNYTVNLTTAMPDTNYCVVAAGSSTTPADARQGPGVSNSSTSAIAVYCGFDNGTGTDWIWVNVAIFR